MGLDFPTPCLSGHYCPPNSIKPTACLPVSIMFYCYYCKRKGWMTMCWSMWHNRCFPCLTVPKFAIIQSGAVSTVLISFDIKSLNWYGFDITDLMVSDMISPDLMVNWPNLSMTKLAWYTAVAYQKGMIRYDNCSNMTTRHIGACGLFYFAQSGVLSNKYKFKRLFYSSVGNLSWLPLLFMRCHTYKVASIWKVMTLVVLLVFFVQVNGHVYIDRQ